MGDGMARNLIKGGRDVVVWNRTGKKAVDFSKDTGCETAQTPKEVGKSRLRDSVRLSAETAGQFFCSSLCQQGGSRRPYAVVLRVSKRNLHTKYIRRRTQPTFSPSSDCYRFAPFSSAKDRDTCSLCT